MSGACWLVGPLTLGGCADSELPLPLPEEARALTSWVLWADGELEASAGGPIRLDLPTSGEALQLVLLGYRHSLSELGLEAGKLATTVTCRSCELVRSYVAWSARVEGSELAADWVPVLDVPSAVMSKLAPDHARCDRCRPFAKTQVLADEPPDAAARIAFLTPWAGHELVAYRDGTLRLLDSTSPLELGGSPQPLCVPSEGFRPWTGYRATETVVWVVDSDNRVRRLDLDRLDPGLGCDEATTLSSSVSWAGPLMLRITGPHSATPDALFGIALETELGVTMDSIVSRHTLDGRTETLGRLAGPENETAIAWGGPGEVLAVNGSPSIIRVHGGVAREERVTVAGVEIHVSTVLHAPARGFVLGTSNTWVLKEEDDGRFHYLADFEAPAQRIDAVTIYEDGLLVGERTGNFSRFFDEEGYCPGQRGFGGQALNHLLVGERGEVLGGDGRLFYAMPEEDACRP